MIEKEVHKEVQDRYRNQSSRRVAKKRKKKTSLNQPPKAALFFFWFTPSFLVVAKYQKVYV